MLKAWNTGHPGGIATVHANSAESALYRLEQLIQEVVTTVPRRLIAEAIDTIVFISGRGIARRIETITQLDGLDPDGNYRADPHPPPMAFGPLKENCMRTRLPFGIGILYLSFISAAYAAGTNMPWEQPLQQILDSVQGPRRQNRGRHRHHRDGPDLGIRRNRGRVSQDDPDRVRPLHRLCGLQLLPDLLLVRRRRAAAMIEGFEVPLYRSLTEPVLLAGAPRAVAVVNGTIAAALGPWPAIVAGRA